MSLGELAKIIENLDLQTDDGIDIAYIPPVSDRLTDEENFDDVEAGDNLGQLSGSYEIIWVEIDDIEVEHNISQDEEVTKIVIRKTKQSGKIIRVEKPEEIA